VPALRARVNDDAGLLSAAQRQELEARLAAFEAQTSHQVVVLTVPSLEGEAIESFALRVVEQWKIGHTGLDNGALILVASGDRRARIEVGYGLEGVIPDAIASRIIRDVMIPSFRAGAMGEGIVRGADAVMAAARGEEIPAARRPAGDRGVAEGQDPLGMALFFAFFGGMIGAAIGRRSGMLGAGAGATIAFVVTFAVLAVLGWAIVSAFLAALIGSTGSGAGRSTPRPRGLPGGWSSGGFGGGGFGGGGFSGGGGSFGGGGASGSW
jgi:uncharacterized protein